MQMRLGLCPIFDKKKGVQQRYYHYFDKLCSSNENSIPCIANITWWLSDLSGYQHTDLLMKHKRYFCYFAETQKAMRSGKLQQISNNNAYLSWREHCIWYLWIWRCLTVWKIRAVLCTCILLTPFLMQWYALSCIFDKKNQGCYSFRFLPVTKFTFTGQVLELNA
jgi:hypothetical protein